MDAIEALRTRRSVRVFEKRAVERGLIEAIVDCGRLAASARNEQPWEFVVVSDASLRGRIGGATDHGRFIAEAPVCVCVFCEDSKYYLEDGAAATQNMLVAAHALGLGSCWVAGDKKPYVDSVRSMLGVPETHRLVSMIALGYAAKVSNPSKRSLEDVIHWERY